ncbi:MAG TPA: sulfatase-like hydrolase/transferase, partial [bacterium]|nr:sulfatase-like hydrolase/transferase [bacterium]
MASLITPGCRVPEPVRRPNVILISLDTLRADALGCYGNPSIRTPVLDTLGRSGILYTDHHVNSNWTLPSHVSIFTSQYAADHRIVYDNRPLPGEAVTIAEVFQSAGYRTGGFYSIHYFAPELNLRQGFDDMAFYDWVDGSDWQRVKTWINTAPDQPFFLFLHTFEPHAPYGGYREYRRDPSAGDLRDLDAFDSFSREIAAGNTVPEWTDYREGMLMMLLGFRKGPDRHNPEIPLMVERMTEAQLRLWEDVQEVPISPVLEPWFDSEYFSPDTGALLMNYSDRVMFTDHAMGRLMHLLQQSG